MASLIPSPLISILFLLLANHLASPSASISSENAVTLSLYYETLCPYCADFIVNHLVKVFDEGLISIVNLRLIPWGNAFLQADSTFLCQHGPNECFLNAIEACAITIYPDVETHFRLIHCIERLSLENKLNEWVNCFEIAGLGKEPIDCYTSGYGNVLEQQFAAETAQLNPQHRFVPWVVVNNQPLQEVWIPIWREKEPYLAALIMLQMKLHISLLNRVYLPNKIKDWMKLQKDFKNFVGYVCKAYLGTRVPEACKSLSMEMEANSLWKENPISEVCFANKTGNFTSPLAPKIKAL